MCLIPQAGGLPAQICTQITHTRSIVPKQRSKQIAKRAQDRERTSTQTKKLSNNYKAMKEMGTLTRYMILRHYNFLGVITYYYIYLYFREEAIIF